MKLTSSSAARRRTASAVLRSFAGPKIPSPVRRIAPKPKRLTESCLPNETCPADFAETSFLLFMTSSRNYYFLPIWIHPHLLRIPSPSWFAKVAAHESACPSRRRWHFRAREQTGG